MNDTPDIRMQAIRTRTRQCRARYEGRQFFCLTACSLLLLTGIWLLLRSTQSPGIALVAGSYGAVLLRDGAGAYVVLGLLAFAAGVAATVLCIRLKVRVTKHMTQEANRNGRRDRT